MCEIRNGLLRADAQTQPVGAMQQCLCTIYAFAGGSSWGQCSVNNKMIYRVFITSKLKMPEGHFTFDPSVRECECVYCVQWCQSCRCRLNTIKSYKMCVVCLMCSSWRSRRRRNIRKHMLTHTICTARTWNKTKWNTSLDCCFSFINSFVCDLRRTLHMRRQMNRLINDNAA